MWELEKADGFENCFKKFSRKHRIEANAVMANLETFFCILNETNNIQAAKQQSFVRKEPEGIVALDSRGAPRETKGTKLKATRLYVYAIEVNATIYLLRIGDKDSQAQDVKTCMKAVKKLRGECER
jgi:hypothetical protein